MANYRPKSLDELNNLYGKSLDARQEIVKKATVLEERTQPKDTAPVSEEKTEYKIREQEANDQIAGYVNDFIKSFGTPVKPDRTAAATVTASMKTVPVGKAAESRKESEAVKAAAENQSEDKPRLIRNSERNSLFENYKKVMDDEDDYDFSDEEKTEKKKPKKLFDKKSAKAVENEKKESAEEIKVEAEKAPEEKAVVAAKSESDEKTDAIAETEVEVKQEAEADGEKEEKKKSKREKKQKSPKEKKQKAPKESKGTVSRAFVMFLIFCVLLCATAVGGVKAFSGINTDAFVMERFHIYTADRDYSRLGINSGDIVIVEHRGVDYDDVFAYKKGDGEYGYAKLNTVLNEECVIADDGDLRCLVFNDTVRGIVYKTIPAVGAIAALIMSDFLAVLGALLILAFILMFIAIFGCKPKEKKAKKEKVKKEKVKKEKKSKKSKKSKKTAEVEEADEAEQTDDAADYEDDESDYSAIEADFSFLLNTFDDESAEAEEYADTEEYEAEVAVQEEPEAEEASYYEPVGELGDESAGQQAYDSYEPASDIAAVYEISDNADEDEEISE